MNDYPTLVSLQSILNHLIKNDSATMTDEEWHYISFLVHGLKCDYMVVHIGETVLVTISNK